jgi:hypothetical protein
MANPSTAPDPLDDDFPTTAKIRRSTARRLRIVRDRAGFPSVDVLLNHLCQRAESDPALLLRQRGQ